MKTRLKSVLSERRHIKRDATKTVLIVLYVIAKAVMVAMMKAKTMAFLLPNLAYSGIASMYPKAEIEEIS